jgi:hypothetical protein
MYKIFLFFFICFFEKAVAQNYDVALVNDSLKKGANAVKRFEEVKVIIKSPSKAIIKRKYAITILNEDGAEFARYINSYDKFFSLENIDGRLFNASGKEIKTVKKKDIADFSANGDESLMTDNRYKRHSFYWAQYPYTVEYEDEQHLDGLLFLPSWNPIDLDCSVELSKFIVEAPSDYLVRYKQIAYNNPPLKTTVKDVSVYTWQLNNCIAVKQEIYQPHWDEINPAIYLAPSTFEIDNYKGDMNSWQGLGKFVSNLNNDRQALPDVVKQDVHSLTNSISSTKEKINILYNYLQKNTRYISVQLGIGGWQTFDAKYVAKNKYGDCKALSNYMVSLLKEINIPAKYVIVNAGKEKRGLWEDFPVNHFNHVIMCVPMQKDTVWLECTSQTESPGYMGSFTGNRKALLIDDDGGHIVNTPTYKAKDNIQIRKVNATINEEGTLVAETNTRFTGIQQETVHSLFHGATPEQKKNYLNSILSLPTYSVEKFEYKETKGIIPVMDEYLSITAHSYATISGKRLFVMPNFFNRSNDRFVEDKDRKYDVQFHSGYVDIDSIQIKIPANYSIEAIPKSVNLKTDYGNYSISFALKENSLNVIRKSELNEGRFPKKEYEAIANYFNEIYKADRGRIVLVKKE